MTAGAIRAGRAFVEMFIDDASVQASLENVKARLKSFGAAVDTLGAASFTRMNAVATASTAATGASVGVLSATMGVLQASVYAVGVAIRSVFGYLTTSVIKAAALIGVLAATVSTYLPGSKLAGFLTNFMNKSQTTEAVGRWTRFFGLLTGSSAIKDLGNRIERLGLGSAIVKGFQTGGVTGGIGATLGAGIRSSKSIIAGAVAGVFTAPFRAVAGLFRGAITSTGIAGAAPLANAATGAADLATNLTRAATAGRSASSALAVMKAIGASIGGIATKVGLFATAIYGPALAAARSFVKSAQEITKAADKTGKDLDELIADKYGNMGIVSPEEDIEAAADLGDALDELKKSSAAAWAQIGIGAIPVLKAVTERLIAVTDAIGGFLFENSEAVTAIISLSGKIAGASAAVLAFVKTWPLVVASVGMAVSPIGLVAIALAGVAIAFPKIREEAVSVFQFMFGSFASLNEIVNQTVQGMLDALSGGSLEAAARVLWAGLNLAWLTGSENLRDIWRTMVTNLASIFTQMYAGLLTGWEVVTNGFMTVWTATQNAIAGGMARLIAFWNGQDVNEVLAELTGMQDADAQARDKAHQQRLAQIQAELAANLQANGEIDNAKRAQAEADLKAAQAEFDAAKAAAAELKKNKRKSPESSAGLKEAASLGTFSIATVGRTNVGGISDLKKSSQDTAENTKLIAENTKDGGLAFS